MFRPLPEYRISHAALGRRLATIIEMEKQAMMNPAQFHDTIFAVYNLILNPDYQPPRDSNHHPVIYAEQKAQIEKAARRSAAAREAARRRRELKKASQGSLDRNHPLPVEPPVQAPRLKLDDIFKDYNFQYQLKRIIRDELRRSGR